MPKNALEDQLAALTREFVAKLVDTLRNASLADVAALSSDSRPRPEREAKPVRARATRTDAPAASGNGRDRQTASRRAEMGDRLTQALRDAGQPMGVRALAVELAVDAASLTVPLRELRAAGKIRKHGDKRATTYSLA